MDKANEMSILCDRCGQRSGVSQGFDEAHDAEGAMRSLDKEVKALGWRRVRRPKLGLHATLHFCPSCPPECVKCQDTGVIETGNNDIACGCPAGKTAVFNWGHFTMLTEDEIQEKMRMRGLEKVREREAIWGLASWLPSYASAQRHYGDRAFEKARSNVVEVMAEASMVLSVQKGYSQSRSIVSLFYCDTVDLENPPSEEEKLTFIKAWFAERGMELQIEEEKVR